jgi:hypothetical protein
MNQGAVVFVTLITIGVLGITGTAVLQGAVDSSVVSDTELIYLPINTELISPSLASNNTIYSLSSPVVENNLATAELTFERFDSLYDTPEVSLVGSGSESEIIAIGQNINSSSINGTITRNEPLDAYINESYSASSLAGNQTIDITDGYVDSINVSITNLQTESVTEGNAFVNGGFEAGDLTGWTVFYSDGGAETSAAASSTYSSEGTYSAFLREISATTQYASINQTIDMSTVEYITFDIYFTTNKRIIVQIDGETVMDSTYASHSVWYSPIINVVEYTGEHEVSFIAYGEEGAGEQFYIDNIVAIEYPEDIIYNKDFNTGAITYWSYYESIVSASYGVTTTYAYEGESAYLASRYGGTAYLYTPIDLTYVNNISCYLCFRNAGTTGTNAFVMLDDTVLYAYTGVDVAGTYNYVNISTSNYTGIMDLKIGLTSNGDTNSFLHIDNVSASTNYPAMPVVNEYTTQVGSSSYSDDITSTGEWTQSISEDATNLYIISNSTDYDYSINVTYYEEYFRTLTISCIGDSQTISNFSGTHAISLTPGAEISTISIASNSTDYDYELLVTGYQGTYIPRYLTVNMGEDSHTILDFSDTSTIELSSIASVSIENISISSDCTNYSYTGNVISSTVAESSSIFSNAQENFVGAIEGSMGMSGTMAIVIVSISVIFLVMRLVQ